MNKNLLSYIICPECKKDELDIEIYAEEIPLKNITFDGCAIPEALHHVSRPDVVVQKVASMITNKGAFYSYDPHMSPVRFIYDFIMKFWKLYDEEASDSLLFTEKQLIQMLHEAGIKCKTKTSTFCHRISSIFSINKIT
ncbi:MAG: hypothetical protein LWW97_05270 [Deltaproteobacteria bacterium]|nr:hypothetical protein [Deltaproteobacteria bacterium]